MSTVAHVAIAVVFVVTSDDNEEPGEPEQAATTSTAAAPATTVTPREASIGMVTGLPRGHLSVVRTEAGRLAYDASNSGDLQVYRSFDGISWEQVAVELPALSTDADTEFTRYSGPIETAGGLMMLHLTQYADDASAPDASFEVDLLVSVDGIVWERGPISPVLAGSGRIWTTDLHDAERVGFIVFRSGNALFRSLLRSAVVEGVPVPASACGMEVSPGGVSVDDCHGDSVTITQAQLRPGLEPATLQSCAEAAARYPLGALTVSIAEVSDGTVVDYEIDHREIDQVAAVDGDVYLLDRGDKQFGALPADCERLLEAVVRSAALVQYSDDSHVRIDLPDLSDPSLWSDGTRVGIWNDEQLAHLRPDGQWEVLLEVPDDLRTASASVRFSHDNTLMGFLTPETLAIGDVDDGSWEIVSLDEKGRESMLLHVEDDGALISTATRTIWVTLS